MKLVKKRISSAEERLAHVQKVDGSIPSFVIYALLAQSVEHQTFNLRVRGSSPLQGF